MRGVKTMKDRWRGEDHADLRDGRTSERGRHCKGHAESRDRYFCESGICCEGQVVGY